MHALPERMSLCPHVCSALRSLELQIVLNHHVWEWNLDSLEEQPVLLNSEPSLQPIASSFNLVAAAKIGNPLGQGQSTVPKRDIQTVWKRSILALLPHFKRKHLIFNLLPMLVI